MDETEKRPAIPRDIAVALCTKVREERASKWYRIFPGQCWGCMKASQGIPEKMCMYDGVTYGGCSFIRRRYLARTR